MGHTVGERTIAIVQMRVTFLELPPMLPDEVLDMEKYAIASWKQSQQGGCDDGDDVSEFTDSVNGSLWYMPDAGKAALLFDQIAANKGMALKLETGYTVDRLREARKNKTVLTFVELAILEAKQA
jgi:hypothetical protein